MLVTAIIDPSAFDISFFSNDTHVLQARLFLEGINENGIIIDNLNHQLKNGLLKQIRVLPIKFRQQIEILLTEILLKKPKRIIACESECSDKLQYIDIAYQLKNSLKVDGLITNQNFVNELERDKKLDSSIFSLSEYIDSDFEKLRKKYLKLPAIDLIERNEVDEAFIRCIKYTKWIRFYDKQIGNGGDNIKNFLIGIRYILNLLRKYGYFAIRPVFGDIQIITAQKYENYPGTPTNESNARKEENERIFNELEKEFIIPLSKEFPWPIKLKIKSDPENIFHARYLQTQYIIVKVDRGFDLFKLGKSKFKRNFLEASPSHSDHLKQCRDLQDIFIL